MADDVNDQQFPEGPNAVRATNWANIIFKNLLEPQRWGVVRDALHRLADADSKHEEVFRLRRLRVEVAFGRFSLAELVGERAAAANVALGPATTQLIERLKAARSAFFRQRGKIEPPILTRDARDDWTLNVDRYTSDPEEDAICDAIDVVLVQADGGNSPGEFDEDTDAAVAAFRSTAKAIEESLESLRKKGTGTVALSSHRAFAALTAAKLALELSWPLAPTFEAERKTEVETIIACLERQKIPRKIMAGWLTEAGIANLTEKSLTVIIHRLRKSGSKRLPRRKNHTVE